LVVDTFLLATIALVKTNVLVPAVAMVVIASGRLLAHRPRWRALLPPALFGTALLSWWLVLGQSVTNLPRYLYRSFEIATGYNDAMGVTGERGMTFLALAILALLGAALFSRSFFKREGVGNALAAGGVGLYFFVQWKHGFVRQDLHQIIFFSMTLLCPFLFPALFPPYRWGRGPRPVLVACAVLLSAAGFICVYVAVLAQGRKAYLAWRAASCLDGARMALRAGILRDRMEQLREELARRYALPRIAARVGDAPVDAFSYEQGVVLLNRLNWTPRPIFQAYS